MAPTVVIAQLPGSHLLWSFLSAFSIFCIIWRCFHFCFPRDRLDTDRLALAGQAQGCFLLGMEHERHQETGSSVHIWRPSRAVVEKEMGKFDARLGTWSCWELPLNAAASVDLGHMAFPHISKHVCCFSSRQIPNNCIPPHPCLKSSITMSEHRYLVYLLGIDVLPCVPCHLPGTSLPFRVYARRVTKERPPQKSMY